MEIRNTTSEKKNFQNYCEKATKCHHNYFPVDNVTNSEYFFWRIYTFSKLQRKFP